jgi:hypothetical protein
MATVVQTQGGADRVLAQGQVLVLGEGVVVALAVKVVSAAASVVVSGRVMLARIQMAKIVPRVRRSVTWTVIETRHALKPTTALEPIEAHRDAQKAAQCLAQTGKIGGHVDRMGVWARTEKRGRNRTLDERSGGDPAQTEGAVQIGLAEVHNELSVAETRHGVGHDRTDPCGLPENVDRAGVLDQAGALDQTGGRDEWAPGSVARPGEGNLHGIQWGRDPWHVAVPLTPAGIGDPRDHAMAAWPWPVVPLGNHCNGKFGN